MRDDGRKLLAFTLATGAVALAIAVVGPRVLSRASGVENELITQLKTAEGSGLKLEVAPVGALVGQAVQYQRLQVTVGADGGWATVTATLDFTGRFEGRTQVSSLGLERIRFEEKGGQWVAPEGFAPRLVGIVRALEGRRRQLEQGRVDAGVSPDLDRLLRLTRRVYRVDAWYIRSEREGVEVAEDYQLTGDLPERPVDERGTRRLSLVEDARGLFLLDGGLR